LPSKDKKLKVKMATGITVIRLSQITNPATPTRIRV
jgi:hypothetical protein